MHSEALPQTLLRAISEAIFRGRLLRRPSMNSGLLAMTKKNLESGQSLLEVIVAMSVGILVVTALVFATIFSLRNATFAKNSAQATKLAQEGIEKARAGRDRNQCILNLDDNVQSWNGSNTECPLVESGIGSIWAYPISNSRTLEGKRRRALDVTQNKCEDFNIEGSGCYFKINDNSSLSGIGYSSTNFPEANAEVIRYGQATFQRVVILSDDLNNDERIDASDDPQNAKKVTVIVRWTDATGPHESKLSTILRRL